jgi:hypothetical protein
LRYAASCTFLTLSILLTGCAGIGMAGGPDKQALARTTVQDYWHDVNHGKIKQAYGLLTPGVRSGITENQYYQNMLGLLTKAGSITVAVRDTSVNGDLGTVKVTLYSPNAKPLNAWQHLFWQNGGWLISDNNAYVSQHR